MDIREALYRIMAEASVGQPSYRMNNFASMPTGRRRGKMKGWEKENRRKGNRWGTQRR